MKNRPRLSVSGVGLCRILLVSGSALSLSSGCHKPPDYSVRRVVPQADQVTLRPLTDASGTPLTMSGEAARLRSSENGAALLSMRHCRDFHTTRRGTRPHADFLITVSAFGGRYLPTDFPPPPTYYYYGDTGEIGRGSDWCTASPEFQAWMKGLRARVSRLPQPPASIH